MTHSATLTKLITRFKADFARLTSNGYTETEARVEYIDPFLELLGWDMINASGQPNSLKDVVREASHDATSAGAASQRPDYTFRIAGLRKFFVEAKKPAVDIRTHKGSAFQVRQYGYTVGVPVSILTNFRTLRIYNTTREPNQNDDADVGLIQTIELDDIPGVFDTLIARFGGVSVGAGSIEACFGSTVPGAVSVGEKFLARINDWRLRLANDLYGRYAAMPIEDLSDLSQKVVNRIIFIRMCEDRGIEGAETLRTAAGKRDFVELRALFRKLDDRYNTGLFDVAGDRLQDTYVIDAALFQAIVDEVYSPASPYSFAVLDADFLGQVYELFLAKRLQIVGGAVVLVDKPAYEDREVVTTPQLLVVQVVQRAIAARISAKAIASFEELTQLRVLDIAVGSGRFLVHALDKLADLAIEVLAKVKGDPRLYELNPGNYRLSFEAKRAILQKCLFGIDIDFNAVEVARFSLVIKLLEDETLHTLPPGNKILPNLDANLIWGNTVVSDDFHPADAALREQTVPINWRAVGLPSEFDVVIGNPPYVKTEEMVQRTPEELSYYKQKYSLWFKQFDKYFIFLERAINAASPLGSVGFVLPNKWMTIESAAPLRRFLAAGEHVADIVDFGNENLFSGKSAYVCLLTLKKGGATSFGYRNIHSQADFEAAPDASGFVHPSSTLTAIAGGAWVLPANPNEARILSQLMKSSTPLKNLVDVRNGIQTSKNTVFVIKKFVDNGATLQFEKAGRTWDLESSITRPYVEDSMAGVRSYCPVVANARVIFPYESVAGAAPRIISPADMQAKFPLAWAYFSHFKAELSNRSVNPPPPPGVFYAFGRHQALDTVFTCPKIVYSVNQKGEKYGFDTSGVAVASGGTAGEVMLLNTRDGYALEFFLGLLNQRAIEFFLRKRGSPFRGGYYSRGTAVMGEVPVPMLDLKNDAQHIALHDGIVQDVRAMQLAKQTLTSAAGRRITAIERQIAALELSLQSKFDTLWGFVTEVDDLVLPGQ
ncbi:MAG: N-6 DNA methylase [Massilia sp.]